MPKWGPEAKPLVRRSASKALPKAESNFKNQVSNVIHKRVQDAFTGICLSRV